MPHFRWLTAGLFFASVLGAQSNCQISGRVVRADGQRPLIRASVTASRIGSGSALELTDAQGRFCFNGLPVGDYLVSARKSLYSNVIFGSTPGHAQGKILHVAAVAAVADLQIVLPRLGAVAGHIITEDGEPARTAQVALLRLNYRRGKAALIISNTARVNIRGDYRFSGVLPGKYYLSASDTDPGSPWQATNGGALDRPRSARVYYPAADDFDSARLIEVKPGEEVTGLDLTLNRQVDATVEIRGVAPTACAMQVRFLIRGKGIQANDLMVSQVFFGRPRGNQAQAANDGMQTTAHIAPGNYRLLVECPDASGKGSYRALEDVAISGDTTLDVTLSRGADLSGTIRWSGPSDKKLSDLRVRLTPGDTAFQRTNLAANADAEGRFTIKDVPPGVWDIAVDGMPAGAFLASGKLGDQDVLFEDMSIGTSISDSLNLVVNPRGATLRGTVEHLDDRRAYVVLEPADHERNPLINYQTLTGPGGHFQLTALRPGTYRAYALLDSRPGDMDPNAFLSELESQATTIEIKEGEAKEVTLAPLSIESTAPGAKR